MASFFLVGGQKPPVAAAPAPAQLHRPGSNTGAAVSYRGMGRSPMSTVACSWLAHVVRGRGQVIPEAHAVASGGWPMCCARGPYSAASCPQTTFLKNRLFGCSSRPATGALFCGFGRGNSRAKGEDLLPNVFHRPNPQNKGHVHAVRDFLTPYSGIQSFRVGGADGVGNKTRSALSTRSVGKGRRLLLSIPLASGAGLRPRASALHTVEGGAAGAANLFLEHFGTGGRLWRFS